MPPETYEERRRNAPPSAPAAGFQKDLMQDGAAADIDENTRRFPITLAQSGVAASVTGTTAATVLASVTIPGGLMGENGQIEVTTLWSHTNSANTKILRVSLNGVFSILSAGATTSAASQVMSRVSNRGSESAQVSYNSGIFTPYGTTGTAVASSAIDTASDVTLTIIGILANTSETITLESYAVKVFPAA